MGKSSEQNVRVWILTGIFGAILAVSIVILIAFYSTQNRFTGEVLSQFKEIQRVANKCAEQITYWEGKAQKGQTTLDLTACKQLASWTIEQPSMFHKPRTVLFFSALLLSLIVVGGLWACILFLEIRLFNRYKALRFKYENLQVSYKRFVTRCSTDEVE